MNRILCDIYRSNRKEGLYLYIERKQGLECVPKELQERFGTPTLSLTMLLSPEKPLAQVPVDKVMAALQEKGYYLQLPTVGDDYMQAINEHNSKLER